MDSSIAHVKPDSHLTLNYRVSLQVDGTEVISTFGARPATLQMGMGQFADALERVLLDLPEGSQQRFELGPGKAYGERSADMVQQFSRRMFDQNTDTNVDGKYQPGDLVEINAPDGARVAGVLKAIDSDRVLIDFNHPLAGQAIVFEVEILGVL